MIAIEFNDVSKQFGSTRAVDQVSLSIEQGSFVTIIGSSGCGKTTLLKMVNALAMPDEGSILIHGKSTADLNPSRTPTKHRLRDPRKRSVSPDLTVEQNIAYVPRLLNRGASSKNRSRGGQMDEHHWTFTSNQRPLSF